MPINKRTDTLHLQHVKALHASELRSGFDAGGSLPLSLKGQDTIDLQPGLAGDESKRIVRVKGGLRVGTNGNADDGTLILSNTITTVNSEKILSLSSATPGGKVIVSDGYFQFENNGDADAGTATVGVKKGKRLKLSTGFADNAGDTDRVISLDAYRLDVPNFIHVATGKTDSDATTSGIKIDSLKDINDPTTTIEKSIRWNNGVLGPESGDDLGSYWEIQGGSLVVSRCIPSENLRDPRTGVYTYPTVGNTKVMYSLRINDLEQLEIVKQGGLSADGTTIGALANPVVSYETLYHDLNVYSYKKLDNGSGLVVNTGSFASGVKTSDALMVSLWVKDKPSVEPASGYSTLFWGGLDDESFLALEYVFDEDIVRLRYRGTAGGDVVSHNTTEDMSSAGNAGGWHLVVVRVDLASSVDNVHVVFNNVDRGLFSVDMSDRSTWKSSGEQWSFGAGPSISSFDSRLTHGQGLDHITMWMKPAGSGDVLLDATTASDVLYNGGLGSNPQVTVPNNLTGFWWFDPSEFETSDAGGYFTTSSTITKEKLYMGQLNDGSPWNVDEGAVLLSV